MLSILLTMCINYQNIQKQQNNVLSGRVDCVAALYAKGCGFQPHWQYSEIRAKIVQQISIKLDFRILRCLLNATNQHTKTPCPSDLCILIHRGWNVSITSQFSKFPAQSYRKMIQTKIKRFKNCDLKKKLNNANAVGRIVLTAKQWYVETMVEMLKLKR